MIINEYKDCLLCSITHKGTKIVGTKRTSYIQNFKRFCEHGIEITTKKKILLNEEGQDVKEIERITVQKTLEVEPC